MMQQMALDMGLASSPSLANFHVGHNSAVMAHLQLCVQANTSSPVPTYLWGLSGCGKSHLLSACAQALRGQGAQVGHLGSETQTFDAAWTAVLMDDVQLLDASSQQQAFNWFINAQTHGIWVLAAGDRPPADLPLRDDLRTRLGWGHVFELHALSEGARRAVVRQEADTRGIFLGDDVMDFMLKRFSRDLTSLMQLLDQLDAYALVNQRAITIPLIKSMLENL